MKEFDDHKAEHRPVYRDFDEREAQKPTQVKVKKHHRGPGKISFPLKAERASILVTDADNHEKALKALKFAEVWRLLKLRPSYPRKWIEERADQHINDFFEDGVVTKEQFREAALMFIHTPRPGIDIAKHKKRIFKLFSQLGIPVDAAKLSP